MELGHVFTIAHNQGMFNCIFPILNIAWPAPIDADMEFIMGARTTSHMRTVTSACNPDISSESSAEPITIWAEQELQK